MYVLTSQFGRIENWAYISASIIAIWDNNISVLINAQKSVKQKNIQ